MKKAYILLLINSICGTLGAQPVSGTVITGPGYENQVWYDMENGEVGSAPLNNWDLAFEISGFTASIRANLQKGIAVFQAPYSTSEWNDLDTSGMQTNWTKLVNDPSDWSRGAFNLFPTSDFDLGWGVYNPVTHTIAGDSLYVISLPDGSFKKLRLDALAGGVYYFTYSDLDGNDEVSAELDKDDFAGKNFGYYSLASGQSIDREPPSDLWDITFTKYMADIDGYAYPVSGVLHNYQVDVADVSNAEENDPWEIGFSTAIDAIGYDWKSFDFSTGWELDQNRSFFVRTAEGDVFELVFTNFEGTATGLYEFGISSFSSLSTDDENTPDISLFPNPVSSGQISLSGDFGLGDRLEIFDMSGKQVDEFIIQSENIQTFSADRLEGGTYLIRLITDQRIITKKLIVTN